MIKFGDMPETIICPNCGHDGKPDGRPNYWHTMYESIIQENTLDVGCNKCRHKFCVKVEVKQ